MLTFMIAMASLFISWHANDAAASAADARAKDAQAQNAHLQATFCDFFVPIADPTTGTQVKTDIGLKIYRGAQTVVAQPGLNCSAPKGK